MRVTSDDKADIGDGVLKVMRSIPEFASQFRAPPLPGWFMRLAILWHLRRDTELSALRAKLAKDAADYSAKTRAAEKLVKAATSRCQTLASKLESQKATCQKLEATFNATVEKMGKNLSEAFAAGQAAFQQSTQAQLTSFRESLTVKQEEVESKGSKIKTISQQLTEAKSNIARLQGELTNIQGERDSARRERDAVKESQSKRLDLKWDEALKFAILTPVALACGPLTWLCCGIQSAQARQKADMKHLAISRFLGAFGILGTAAWTVIIAIIYYKCQ